MKWLAVALATLLFIPVLMGASFAGLDASPGSGGWAGGSEGLGDIPPQILSLYEQAAGHFGIPVAVLAAVGKVECDHNRHPACPTPNSAGAVGPMQFLPSTFARYASAAGSPEPSILDPRDAIFAAAAKLTADGVNRDPWAALYSYNHSDAYVAEVIGWAVAYGWVPEAETLSRAVLNHPRLILRPAARADVQAGRVDGRVLGVLLAVAGTYHLSYVGPFVSGHSRLVAGTDRVSNHAVGRAVDLPVVDGAPVSPANGVARALVEDLARLPAGLIPDELGSPWPVPLPGIDTFDHLDHLHLGYDS